MPDLERIIAKGRAVVTKGPATLRNIVFGKLGIWPVGRLGNQALRDLPTYCISLKRAEERRILMQRQADGLGLNRFEIVDAIDSRDLSYEGLARDGLYDEAGSSQCHGSRISLNYIAGSLSHAAVYDLIVARGHRWTLVLEDDALFNTRRYNRIALDRLPADAEVVFLNTFRSPEKPIDQIDSTLYGMESYTGSAAAYFVSLGAARKLAAAARPVLHSADGFLGRALPVPAGTTSHPFKQVGVTTQVQGYTIYPDVVLNGSVCYYFGSYIPTGRNKAA